MNARKVFCVVCVLVVGLATALEITALAGPPSVEYKPGINLIYRGAAYNVAPEVSVPQLSGAQLPSFLRAWTSTSSAALLLVTRPTWNDIMNDWDLLNNVAPVVPKTLYEFADPRQAGGFDPWDPIGNSFAVSEHSATVQGVWDDDGIPNNTVPVAPKIAGEYSDPRQPGGYDPWDPIGNSFGAN